MSWTPTSGHLKSPCLVWWLCLGHGPVFGDEESCIENESWSDPLIIRYFFLRCSTYQYKKFQFPEVGHPSILIHWCMVAPEAGESVFVCLRCLRKLLPEHERHSYGWEQAISDNHIKSCSTFITIIIHYCLLFFNCCWDLLIKISPCCRELVMLWNK